MGKKRGLFVTRFYKALSVLTLAGVLSGCSVVSDSYDYVSTSLGDMTSTIGEALDNVTAQDPDSPGLVSSKHADATPQPEAKPRTPTQRAIALKQPNHILELEALLASPSPNRDVDVIKFVQASPHATFPDLTQYLVAHAAELPPLVVYELAGRSFAIDRWKGVYWYYVGRVRYAYDLARCTDATTLAHLERADQLVGGPKTQIRLDPVTAYGTALAALRWERDAPIHTVTPLPSCLSGDQSVRTFGVNGLAVKRLKDKRIAVVGPTGQPVNPDNWIKPIPHHVALLDKARLRVRREAEKLPTMSVKLPKEWDD